MRLARCMSARACCLMNSTVRNGCNEPAAIHAFDSDGMSTATDTGHGLLRHEHQGHAIPKHRGWHMVGGFGRTRRRPRVLLGLTAVACVLKCLRNVCPLQLGGRSPIMARPNKPKASDHDS